MFHTVKKKIGKAQGTVRGAPNAEFLTRKMQLSNIKHSLKYTSAMLDSANRSWIRQMQDQRNFSDRFFEAYPTSGDEVHLVAARFAEGSQKLYDSFLREQDSDVKAYQNIHEQVKAYIKEIEAVEKLYGPLIEARSEADRYQNKIDHLERSKKQVDPSKKDRNLQKMDKEKESYKELLADVVAQQNKVYAKHTVVFKAALVSYWLSHEKHVTLMVKSLEDTQSFALTNAAEMGKLDIATLDVEKLAAEQAELDALVESDAAREAVETAPTPAEALSQPLEGAKTQKVDSADAPVAPAAPAPVFT